MKEYKIGQKIKIVNTDGDCRNTLVQKGDTGTIIHFEGGSVGVDFGKDIGGHNCYGAPKPTIDGHGYYIHESNFELIKEKCRLLIKYNPKMSVTDHIKKILKYEKDKDRVRQLRAFQNCVLPKKVKDMIDEALTVVLRSSLFEEWGINDHFEKGLTNSMLIYGPPGTGKTMITESIASVLGKNLIRLDNAQLQSNIPGQTEKNISKAFQQAKDDDAVIMLDECDSILHNRDMVGAILGAEINHFLTELERFDGVVVLTTNRLHRLDEALQRRIIAKIELSNPTYPGRVKIWQKLVPPKMPVDKIDYKRLGKPEMSGGEIKNAILLAARKAIAQNKNKVTMKHFEDAATNILNSKKDFDDCKIKTKDITQVTTSGKQRVQE